VGEFLGVDKAVSLTLFAQAKYPELICRPIAVVRESANQITCIEFEPGAGLWAVALFADSKAEADWSERVQAAIRLLGDIGFGGSRSTGWGQAPSPECQLGDWPALLFPKLARGLRNGAAEGLSPLHWLLSLYTPAADDSVNWAEGKYSFAVRGGRVESSAGWGAEKKLVRMVTEGSVVSSGASPRGQAVDVAPDQFAHPVYRAGFALALQLPFVHIIEETQQHAVIEEVTEAGAEVEPVELAPAVVEEADAAELGRPEAEKHSLIEEPPATDLPTESESSREVTPTEAAETEPMIEDQPAPELATVAQEEATEHIDAEGLEKEAFDFESAGDVTPVTESVVAIASVSQEETSAKTEDAMESTEQAATPEATLTIAPEAAHQTTTEGGKVADDEL